MTPNLPENLSTRHLQRAVLARQRLLERTTTGVPDMLELVGGLQSQYAPTMYIGLWSRLDGFARDQLTSALEARTVVQGTMLRSTIHLVSAADYWPLNLAIRAARRTSWLRSRRGGFSDEEMAQAAERVRHALDTSSQLTRKELEAIVGKPQAEGVGLWIDLVRVPPSGTWARRRADLYAAAEEWLGPPPSLDQEAAVDHLVRRYLAAFGPATVNEIANWAGLGLAEVQASLDRLTLRTFRSADGKRLVDLPDLPLPDPDVAAPPRLLSTWEAILLVHARRSEVLREEDRSRIFNTKIPHSLNTLLVDGQVAGTWRFEHDAVHLTPWRQLSRTAERELRDEADRLAAFHR